MSMSRRLTVEIPAALATRLDAMLQHNNETQDAVLSYLITSYCDAGEAMREAGEETRYES